MGPWGISEALAVSKFTILVSLDDLLVSLPRIVQLNPLHLGAFDDFIVCWNVVGIETLADSKQAMIAHIITPYQNYQPSAAGAAV